MRLFVVLIKWGRIINRIEFPIEHLFIWSNVDNNDLTHDNLSALNLALETAENQ